VTKEQQTVEVEADMTWSSIMRTLVAFFNKHGVPGHGTLSDAKRLELFADRIRQNLKTLDELLERRETK